MALIGHADAVDQFKAAFTSGRPHHGWLVAGPPGIGKASFAEAAAIWLLAGSPEGPGFSGADDSPASHLVAASSHPDFRRLVRTVDDKGKLRTVIRVDEVRALQSVLGQTPSLAPWRVVIVDSAEEMNPNAANALLKNLEEPPQKTLFLLISHAPGRLLPTLRSRCRLLRLHPLADAEMNRFLDAHADELPEEDRAVLLRLADGSPGAALRFAEPGLAELDASIARLTTLPPADAHAAALALARSLTGKTASARYAAFLERVPAVLAAAARQQQGARLARTIDDWQAANRLAASAGPLTLDPHMVAFDLATRLARLNLP
ncbi:DNA polymerase III subunit delta' [Polymorphobacter sp.]|uniref:DNA polymerase III subunit delta' n=1 Tax=Polymorphobacter sp. TaxID=1909290 RepID=UPI003F6FB7E7